MDIENLFTGMGVDVERLTNHKWKLEPRGDIHEAFPWLKGEPMHITFRRKEAINEPKRVFLSLDHPMVVGVLELLQSSHEGNCSVAIWKSNGVPDILLECIFAVDCVAPMSLNIDRFLSSEPLYLIINHKGDELSAYHNPNEIAAYLEEAPSSEIMEHREILDTLLPQMLNTCRKLAEKEQSHLVANAQQKAKDELGGEINRLKYLHSINNTVAEDDILSAEKELAEVQVFLSKMRVRLDSLRLIFKGDM